MDEYLANRRGAVPTKTFEADAWAVGHLRRFWGKTRPSEVTPQLVDVFTRQKLAESQALQARIDAGERPLEERSYVRRSDGATVRRRQPRKPLSKRSINALVQTLATLLDIAMERPDVAFAANAARGRRRKLKIRQPKFRSFLEVDQVWALLDAATIREQRARANRPDAYPARVILSALTLGGFRIAEFCAAERGLVNLSIDVFQTSRSKTDEGYREVDIMFEVLHKDLEEHLSRPTPFNGSYDLIIPSNTGNQVMASSIRQRVLAKTLVVANELLRERDVPEIRACTPHTLRRTYISLMLGAGCDPAYVQQQVGHTHPMLTLRIYQQLLKRKRREEYRERVNELLGTSPDAMLKRTIDPDMQFGGTELGPNLGPNALPVAA
jgi:integrase